MGIAKQNCQTQKSIISNGMDMKVREEAGKREKERNKQTKKTHSVCLVSFIILPHVRTRGVPHGGLTVLN